MGWTSFSDCRAMTPGQILEREFTGGNDHGHWSIVDQSTRGSVWYAVAKFTATNGAVAYYGRVCLFSRKNGEFAYKDMTEDCGPCEAKAPLRLVNMLDQLAPIAPDDDSMGKKWAREWRARCRAYAAKQKTKKPAIGQSLQYAGKTYTVTGDAGPRRGLFVQLNGAGMTYRLPARALPHCIIV